MLLPLVSVDLSLDDLLEGGDEADFNSLLCVCDWTAAAAVAAKIAAQYGASSSASSGGHDARSPSAGDVRKPDLHDAEFTHDIEINDQRNRYMLTKGQTQKQLEEETGASVTTKGTWYPDKSLATAQDPPLFLHISATTKEILDKAIAAINELMAQDVPQLIEDRHAKRLEYEAQRRAHAPPGVSRFSSLSRSPIPLLLTAKE